MFTGSKGDKLCVLNIYLLVLTHRSLYSLYSLLDKDLGKQMTVELLVLGRNTWNRLRYRNI